MADASTNNSKTTNKGVLIIYTGGTIGSMPKDPDDTSSPQVVIGWEQFLQKTPVLAELKFPVDAYSTKPLDSCNLGIKEWQEIARAIEERYDHYEGFVILHGTDTMVYTASALSFMFQNLAKPVVLTGAQLTHLFHKRNDAFQNMLTAIEIANPAYYGHPVIPEVCIYFGGKIMRGNRTRKINATGFDAYESRNYPPLGTVGESIRVNERLLLPVQQGKTFQARTRMSPEVVPVYFFPGIQDGSVLPRIMQDTKVRGIILLAYGAGNIPTSESVMKLVRDLNKRGVVVLDVTQCGGGNVELGMYETSALLLDAGVVSGVDVTPEAAVTKLLALLGDEDLTPQEVAMKAQQSLAGEQSLSIFITEFKANAGWTDAASDRYRIPATDVSGFEKEQKEYERVVLRFRGGKINSTASDVAVEIKLFIDANSDDNLDTLEKTPKFLGTFRRRPNATPTILFFDITEKVLPVLEKRASFTVRFASEQGSFAWDAAELAIFK